MPISGGIAGGGGGYLSLIPNGRIIGSNAGAGNASDNVIFIGTDAGAANAGTRNIGIGNNAAKNAFTTDLIVIGYGNPTRIGEIGGNLGGQLIGNSILAAFFPSALVDCVAITAVGNAVMGAANPGTGLDSVVAFGYHALYGRVGTGGGGAPPTSNYSDVVAIGRECGAAVGTLGGVNSTVLIGAYAASVPHTSNPDGFIFPLFFNESVIVGTGACLNFQGDSVVAVGAYALAGSAVSNVTINTSDRITAVGHTAGLSFTRGFDNVFLGSASATDLVNGTGNTLIGASTVQADGGIGDPSNYNTIIGFEAGNANRQTSAVFIGRHAGNSVPASAIGLFVLENVASAVHAEATPYLYGDMTNGNLMLGNREDATGPLNRLFGANAVNNWKIQLGTPPTTAPDEGVSLYVKKVVGVYSLCCMGPGGVEQVIKTGL